MPRATDRKAATAAAVKRLAEQRRARGGGSAATAGATTVAKAAGVPLSHSDDEDDPHALENQALSARAARVIVSSDDDGDEDDVVEVIDDGVESDDLADALAALDVAPTPGPRAAPTTSSGRGRGRGRGRGAAAATAQAPGAPPPGPATPPPPAGPPLVLGAGSAYELILRGDVAGRLYAHQRDGVAWLHSLLVAGGQRAASPPPGAPVAAGGLRTWGGLLADDMGLGKTMQCSAFLAGAFDSGLARRALVVAPKTLLAQWAAELAGVGLGPYVREYLSPNPSEREASLQAVAEKGRGRGILLTTYGMVLHNASALGGGGGGGAPTLPGGGGGGDDDDGAWDVLICDEGHRLKNARTQLMARISTIPVRTRVVLSGTPVQNDLGELFTLMDWAAPGLLGDAKAFKADFERPITAGADRGASERERAAGAGAAAELRARLAPCFLRRDKASVFGSTASSSTADDDDEADDDDDEDGSSGALKPPAPAALGTKTDLVVWLRLTDVQRQIYGSFLQSAPVRAALNRTGSVLAAISTLKKVCDHPALLTERAAAAAVAGAAGVASEEDDGGEDEAGDEEYKPPGAGRGRGRGAGRGGRGRGRGLGPSPSARRRVDLGGADAPLPEEDGGGTGPTYLDVAAAELEQKLLDAIKARGPAASCKTAFAPALIARLVSQGHRCLLFAQSRVLIDIIQAELEGARGLACERIDGTVATAAERAARVARFQAPDGPPVMLLTTAVGGLGLTLTAATRVIVADPAWNPAADDQAVDRAYRIGQAKDVVVYRLVSAGTVEEKIYRKQVFKGNLARAGTRDGVAWRYFTQEEVTNLFSLNPAALDAPETCAALNATHAADGAGRPARDEAVALMDLPGFAGASDHGLLYSRESGGPVDPPRPPRAGPDPADAQPVGRGRGRGRGRGATLAGGRGAGTPPAPRPPGRPPATPPAPTGPLLDILDAVFGTGTRRRRRPRDPWSAPKPRRPAGGAGTGRGRGRGSSSSSSRPPDLGRLAGGLAVDLLGRALRGLGSRWGGGGGGAAQAAAPPPPPPQSGPPGSGGGGAPPSSSSAIFRPAPPPPPPPATEAELEAVIRRMKNLLADKSLALPDGGAAARRKLEDAQAALAAARAGGGRAASGPTTGAAGATPPPPPPPPPQGGAYAPPVVTVASDGGWEVSTPDAGAGGWGGPPAPPPPPASAPPAPVVAPYALRARYYAVKGELASAVARLSDPAEVATMPDGGAALRAWAGELAAEKDRLRAALGAAGVEV